MPAASIIVPCYNGGRYLDQLVTTVRAQTFTDYEFIIIDDGSTDQATIEKLASLPSDIRVVRQENRGLSGARNTGFREARAPLVLTLDCDDQIDPTHLAKTVPALQQAPADAGIAYTHLRLGGGNNRLVVRDFHPFDVLFSNGLMSCVLVKKSVWREVGGYDEKMRHGYEDWEFYLRIAHAGYRGIEIPEPLYIYCIEEGGMLISRSSQRHASLWRYMRSKHRELYRLPAILSLWWRTRHEKRRISLWKAMAMLAFTTFLPDAAQAKIIGYRRKRFFFSPHAAST